MQNLYDAECEGCGQYLEISLYGHIGQFSNVWCEECGFEGENIPKAKPKKEITLTVEELKKLADSDKVLKNMLDMIEMNPHATDVILRNAQDYIEIEQLIKNE